MRLQGKVAVITGGTSGIGRRMVERFVEERGLGLLQWTAPPRARRRHARCGADLGGRVRPARSLDFSSWQAIVSTLPGSVVVSLRTRSGWIACLPESALSVRTARRGACWSRGIGMMRTWKLLQRRLARRARARRSTPAPRVVW